MFKNNIKIAWRNIIRHKGYTIINMLGLSIGITACLLIFVIIQHELSYDTFNANAKHIYRIVTENSHSDGNNFEEGISAPVADAMHVDFPQLKVSELYANYPAQINVLGNGDNANGQQKKFLEDNGAIFIDPKYAEVFDNKWLVGDAHVLAEPNTVVLDKSHAVKYFGDWKNAVGQTLKMDNLLVLKVAGIIEDQPSNSDFPMKVLVSFITLKQHANDYSYQINDWGANTSNHQVYILLPQAEDANAINKQLIGFVNKHYDVAGMKTMNTSKKLFLQPLSEIHFDKRFGNLGDHSTSKTTLWTLALIGVFILIMASINFVNLSTAQAVGRCKEIGIRKVLGSNRIQLIVQVLGETAIIVILSMLVSVCAAKLVLPYLSTVASVPENVNLLSGRSVVFLIFMTVVVTVLSGIYPAAILSDFKPALTLKSKISAASIGNISLRRILVVGQFAISQVLIIGMVVAVSQMKFIRNADLGFNKDAVLVAPNIGDSAGLQKMEALKNQLQNIAGVTSVSFMFDAPSSTNSWQTNFKYDHAEKEPGFDIMQKQADADYFKTFGLQFVAGHGYQISDTLREVVVNETLLKKLGVNNPKDAIGKTIKLGKKWFPITGVVKDFKAKSLREETKPIVIFERKKYYSNIGIKLTTTHLSETVAAIKTVWEKTFPDYVYTPEFLDETIAKFYKQENQLELIYKIFACLAIFISCLGLYGLVSFMTQQKTKDVGVRKVLGASISSIVFLFSKEFTILIGVAFAIAVPVAYFLMQSWLQNFAYRIPLGFGVFALAIIASILIAWITVGYKAIKAAMANPIKSLKTE